MYTCQHDRLSGKRWQCVQRGSGCKGAVKTVGLADPVIVGTHNHEPSVEKVDVAKARETMKRTAETGIGKPAQIFNRVQAALNDDARVVLASGETCKRTIRRSLTRNEPAQPDDLQVNYTNTFWTYGQKNRTEKSEKRFWTYVRPSVTSLSQKPIIEFP